MKTILLLVATIFLFAICPMGSYSQNEKVTPAFKFVGETKVRTFLSMQEGRSVEYDPNSSDHLFISYLDKDGLIVSKRQFLFKAKRFYLEDLASYFNEKKLVADGSQFYYQNDGSIEKEDIFKDEILKRRTNFYPDGKKKQMSSGDENTLNGEYQIWYPNGQLSFSGNYKNNFKEGEFQQFDPSGTLIKKGIYMDGILVDGEPVVQDIVFENPEVPAKYNNGDETIEDFLKMKSGQIDSLKKLSTVENVVLLIFIDKTGKITKLDTQGTISPLEFEILKVLLKPLPKFLPAKVENIPVDSQLTLELLFSNSGIKLASGIIQDDKIEKMPEFPGGDMAFGKFLATNMRYPEDAIQTGIQGKVYVSFIVDEDGSLTSFKVTKSVSFALDNEAIRVVKSMPKWIPGYQLGKPVKVLFTVPLNFVLQ